MIKNMVCIECPQGCLLSVDSENGKVTKVLGAKCPKGTAYAIAEIADPVRIFTSTVTAEGLSLKMVPVRTDKPVPKKDILRVAREIAKVRISSPVKVGDVIVDDMLGLGVKLLATREVS